MEEKPPVAEMWVRDVETLKVFADPRRLEILRLMEKPITVKEIADQLDISASKLYYHVNLLEKQGLIRAIDYNLESRIVEKIYQVSARQFKLVNPMLMGDEMPEGAADALLSSMLEDTKRDFLRAYETRDKNEGTPPRHPFISKKAFRLTDAQLTALHAKLDDLIQEVTALGEENAHINEALYELTVVFYKEQGHL